MSDGLITNTSSRTQQRYAATIERRRQMRAEDDLRALLQTPAFQRWVYGHLKHLNMLQNVFSPDALVMAFNAGRQNTAHELAATIEAASPGSLFELMKMDANQQALDLLEAKAARVAATKDEGADDNG